MQLRILFTTMILLNLFAYLTIVIRPRLYGVALFKPMIWNFKLSLLPLIVLLVTISIAFLFLLARVTFGVELFYYLGIGSFFIGLALWFVLLPNSGYLITELNLTHRQVDEKKVPIWYDIISILSLALSGVVNMMANIVVIQVFYLIIVDPVRLSFKNQLFLFLLTFVIILFASIGIYLGRSIRFNTWDLLHPISFIKKFIHHFRRKGAAKDAFLFIFFHLCFFILFYYMLGIPFYFSGI